MRTYRTYDVAYRERGNKEGQIFHTSITAMNNVEAEMMAKEELTKEGYTVISVRRERN